eukprot:Sdes_comp18627_c0_seq1m8815
MISIKEDAESILFVESVLNDIVENVFHQSEISPQNCSMKNLLIPIISKASSLEALLDTWISLMASNKTHEIIHILEETCILQNSFCDLSNTSSLFTPHRNTLVSCRDPYFHYTPLHWAAKFGNKLVLYSLIHFGAPVNASSKGGYSPLHLAAYFGHTPCILLLLCAAADPHAEDFSGKTPEEIAKGNSYKLASNRCLEGTPSFPFDTPLCENLSTLEQLSDAEEDAEDREQSGVYSKGKYMESIYRFVGMMEVTAFCF